MIGREGHIGSGDHFTCQNKNKSIYMEVLTKPKHIIYNILKCSSSFVLAQIELDYIKHKMGKI